MSPVSVAMLSRIGIETVSQLRSIGAVEVSLKMARAQPLDTATARALDTAHATLLDCWARLGQAPADLAGAPLPEALQHQWSYIAAQTAHVQGKYNQQVRDYNFAIDQFPANLLAWVCSFEPAYPLRDIV